MLERTEFQLKGDINGLREQWPRARCAAIIYLVLTFRTDPHAFGNVFEGWVQAVEVVDARTCVTHEQLSTASAHSAEILMDVSLSGRTAGVSTTAPFFSWTNQMTAGKAGRRRTDC